MNNSFGELFRITSFGESHGLVTGVIIDGCPAGLILTEEDIQREVDKRKPDFLAGQTARAEEDKVEILSGVFQKRTTGAPICLLVWNRDTDSTSYDKMRFTPRPGHADYTADIKYGGFNDYRGGGRFSGRVTVGMVMAGAVAKKVLSHAGIEVLAHTTQIGEIKAKECAVEDVRRNVYYNPLRCADAKAAEEMLKVIEAVTREGDSLGGVIEGIALQVPVGLGEPLFDTLEGELSRALFAIPAVKGVEFGAGFSASTRKGSENNDAFVMQDGKIITRTNNAGGILGGISNGMPLIVKVVVKPTPSIYRKQDTVDINMLKNTELIISGRHDVCIVPRAVIVVESMMANTLCDFALRAGILPRILK
jgi:chorismate synthase